MVKSGMHERPDFPTMEQVESASREQLAWWYRFLPSGDTPEQRKIMTKLVERFKAVGGMSPELSKKIGFSGTKEAASSKREPARR